MEKIPFDRKSGYIKLSHSYLVFNHFVELSPFLRIVLNNILVQLLFTWLT